jgi:hypothetical protein
MKAVRLNNIDMVQLALDQGAAIQGGAGVSWPLGAAISVEEISTESKPSAISAASVLSQTTECIHRKLLSHVT